MYKRQGVTWTAGVGDRVSAGQELFRLSTDDADRVPRALEALADAVTIGAERVEPGPVVLGRIA